MTGSPARLFACRPTNDLRQRPVIANVAQSRISASGSGLSETVDGKTLDKVIAFHDQARVPIQSRSARKDDKWHLLYCFAERRHAVAFQLMFGGELVER